MTGFEWLLVGWFALNMLAYVVMIGREVEFTFASAAFYWLVAGYFIYRIVTGALS